MAVRLGDALRRAAGGGGSAIAAAYLNLLGHGVGWPSPEGGAGRLTDALVSHLRELGGELRTGAPVGAIVAERGRVSRCPAVHRRRAVGPGGDRRRDARRPGRAGR
ncbi:MAG: hypothetical protein WKF40_11570 [Thermoleophilaceae bacterium]